MFKLFKKKETIERSRPSDEVLSASMTDKLIKYQVNTIKRKSKGKSEPSATNLFGNFGNYGVEIHEQPLCESVHYDENEDYFRECVNNPKYKK